MTSNPESTIHKICSHLQYLFIRSQNILRWLASTNTPVSCTRPPPSSSRYRIYYFYLTTLGICFTKFGIVSRFFTFRKAVCEHYTVVLCRLWWVWCLMLDSRSIALKWWNSFAWNIRHYTHVINVIRTRVRRHIPHNWFRRDFECGAVFCVTLATTESYF